MYKNFRSSVVTKLTSGVAALIRANKITLVKGEAKFTGPKTLDVDGKEYTADKIIIAVGSDPVIPDIPGLRGSKAFLDSTACLALDHIPQSLLVIGGGVIGLELGTVYRRYGSKVTVVEMTDRLLPLMDSELTALLQTKLQHEGLDILTSAKVVSVTDSPLGVAVRIDRNGNEEQCLAEKILVCVAVRPILLGLILPGQVSARRTAILRSTTKWRPRHQACTLLATATGN